jgi:monoterpene epsilon-lactone hydrolase
MPSAEMQRFSRIIRERRPTQPLSIPERRRLMEAAQAQLPMPEDVIAQNVGVADRPARWLAVPESRVDRILLYLHGGGYVLGSLDTHAVLMARLARACRCRVLGLDYRLAPEHPFPAALEDAVAAYRALLELGESAARIVLAGDSAGGGLALATLLALRDAGVPLPAGAVLLSPWADLTASGASISSRAAADPMLDLPFLNDSANAYRGAADPQHPHVSPYFGALERLPPLLIQVGDCEVLLDDSTRLAAAVREAGGSATLEVWEGAFHVFQAFPQLPESVDALDRIGKFFDRHTA